MNNEYYMNEALKEAKKAYKKNEVPIGCIIVKDDKIISRKYNKKELKNISTNHAEILAINDACKKLKTWRLDECTLYTTTEPCMMCCGAIIQSRIKKIVYGVKNEAFGYTKYLPKDIEIVGGILEGECKEILSNFFKERRKK